ncbi:hypothetical protein FBEOM_6011 [Fusarium beomiforme]|uniref:Uncharacterized protein n=1 Tax=Fusarium beomiforme TaxID=44412 RepID=A0A9P5DWQ5_9HYPO|nr:hypothetical protein FBEOM_6011 [Fusarium beomiforme]
MDAINQENVMIDVIKCLKIEDERNDFNDDHISGCEVNQETIVEHVTIWNVNLKKGPHARPLVLATQDPPDRLAFRDMPGYNIFYSPEKPITEEQYPRWGKGVSASSPNVTSNPSNGPGPSRDPTAPAADQLMHNLETLFDHLDD